MVHFLHQDGIMCNTHKSPLIGHKGDFVLIFRCDWNIMISWKFVQNSINFMFNNHVNNLIYKGQHVRFFFLLPRWTFWNQHKFLTSHLGITTIGNSQVVSSTSLIKPTINNLSVLFDNGNIIRIQLVPCLMSKGYYGIQFKPMLSNL